ncbi:MAG: SIS domain-containing protein [Tenericutes bacterium]|nr:SIS domain-containing protein [Mycoplasmatota bacterium]
MTFMEKEIFEQPDRLVESYLYNKEKFKVIRDEIKKRKIKSVIFTARGSSDNSGIYFKYLCEVICRIPVSFAAPSVITLYDSEIDLLDSLVIGVSQSGQAEDVLSVIDSANKQGVLTVTITNYEDSPIAKAGNFHLHLHVGEEKSVAATKTFMAQMYLLGMLVSYMSDDEQLYKDLIQVPNEIAKAANNKHIEVMAKKFINVKDCFILARGYNYAIAEEFALKLQETTYIKALSYAISDFYHGPLALMDNTSNFIVLAPDDETSDNSYDMIEAIKQRDSSIIIFTDSSKYSKENTLSLQKNSRYITPYTYIITAQLFALKVSLGKGINPDVPRGLKKVTITK